MNNVEAAGVVLKESGRPMTVAEITQQALDKGLVSSKGRTPQATMGSALYTHVRDTPGSPIRRQFQQGPVRARRKSVRWVWVG